MEFVDPIIAESELPQNQGSDDSKANQVTQRIENEIDKAYESIEKGLSDLWKNASKGASDLQTKYQLEEYKKQLSEKINDAKGNINADVKVKENLSIIENRLKNISRSIPDVGNISKHASSAFETLDSGLESVEIGAGKAYGQFTSFFSGILSMQPAQDDGNQKETLFSSSLRDTESYGTSRYDTDLHDLHVDTETFTRDSDDVKDDMEKFDVDKKTDTISELLKKYPNTLDKTMNSLVPTVVSYKAFWYRYFKAEDKLKMAEEKRQSLLRKSDEAKGDEDEDDEEFDWDNVEDDIVEVKNSTL